MSQKPSVGRVVHFYLNDDMVVSPAEIIATFGDMDFELLERNRPVAETGSFYVNEDSDLEDASSLVLRAGFFTDDDERVSLRVSGLIKDYRVYNVPFSGSPKANHWSWPPRV